MMINNSVGMPTSSIMTGLLSQRKAREFSKSKNQMYIKATEDGSFYRVRLLNTTPSQKFMASSSFQHYRDFPFIVKHIHQVWVDVPTDDPAKPKRVCKTIVCPQTDYVKANSTLTKASCPMCAAYGSAWNAFNNSHGKNQLARERMKLNHNTQVTDVLVYVVDDPNHPENNGSVKVITLDDDAYKALLTQIQAAQANNTPIWNNDACDLFFTWGKVEKVVNKKNGDSYSFQKNGFTRIGFTTTPKHLDGLTEELIDDVGFDANWYLVPTKEDLEAFYLENCSGSTQTNDDIPSDIPAVAPISAPKAVAPAPKPVAPKADPIAQDVTEDVDNIPPPPPPKPAKKEPAKAAPADINDQIDNILAGMM